MKRLLKKIKLAARHRYRQAAFRLLRNLKRFPEDEALLIFADPRGGSTWITELICELPRTALLWEPINPELVPAFRALNFTGPGRRQYIPPDDSWPEARRVFSQLLEGKITNSFLGQKITPSKYLKSDQIIIKFVKGSAILPWLTKKFDFKYEPIYFIRHPFATVSSQLRHGAWDYEYNGFSIPDCAYAEIYRRHESFLSTLKTKEEELTALWAISNKFALKNERNNDDWMTITYEKMLTSPKSTLDKISKRWEKEIPKSAYEKVRIPSNTSKNSDKKKPENQIIKWKKNLRNSQIERMNRVISYFGIKKYGKSEFPKEKK